MEKEVTAQMERAQGSVVGARGVVYIHSAPRALSPHVEWAAGRALGRAVNFDWRDQPVLPGSQRTEYYWEGPRGTGAALASALLRFPTSAPEPSGARDAVTA